MAEAQTTPQTYEFKELDKFTMFAPAPGVEGKRARLTWSSFRGNPRMTVFTGIPNDTNKGVINAGMNPETFYGFLYLLEKIAQNPQAAAEYILDSDTLKEDDNGERKKRVLASSIYFGRDEEGVMYMKVKAEGRPEIRFNFKISDWHRFRKGDGTPLSEREGSSLQAISTVHALRQVFGNLVNELRPPFNPGQRTGGKPQASRPATKQSQAEFDDIGF